MEQERSAAEKRTLMRKIATMIVDKRGVIFFVTVVSMIFCAFSSSWVDVCEDLTAYLPQDSETCIGLKIAEEEFTTSATARIMLSNVTADTAQSAADAIGRVDGVTMVSFDRSESYYKNASALFDITFLGAAEDPDAMAAYQQVLSLLADYDVSASSELASTMNETISHEMQLVTIIVVFIIIGVLLLTSNSYMEVPVLLITFGVAALLNLGTNYFFGTISMVTNAIAVILQLALAIDYAIILCHRYTEERATNEPREAIINALSKAIVEIAGSSMTTISGLAAMMLMQFRLGYDMGIVLIKAIVCSMLSVFLLMPGLLMLFARAIEKTRHKSCVLRVRAIGRFAVKTRYIMPPLFLAVVVAAYFLAANCPYVYGYSTLHTIRKNDTQRAEARIEETFGTTNTMMLLVPSGDYDQERALLAALSAFDEVDSALGLAGVAINDTYTVTSALTPRQFSELTQIDYDVCKLLYDAYAAEQGRYGQIISGIENDRVPLLDMFNYLYEKREDGYLDSMDSATLAALDTLHGSLAAAQEQLCGENYSRFVIRLNLPLESDETYAFLETIHKVTARYYDESYLVGNSQSQKDLMLSFEKDNRLISIMTALFVIFVLLLTFKSAGLPILLILVIQGSVWINFSFPYLTGNNLFFLSYLIVSSIQMGANIDYAIVISNRYMALKQTMPIREAIVEALNQAFPTIITSGTMLCAAGFLIGLLSSEMTTASIGICLGRGTLISMLLVLCVLPQILLLGDILIEKTAFTIKTPGIMHRYTGTMRVNGRVRGMISGYVDAEMRGTVQGSISAMVDAGALEEKDGGQEETAKADPDSGPEPDAGKGDDGHEGA